MFGLFFFLAIQETNAVHVNVGAGSYLEINIPMTVGENGELVLRLICFHNVFFLNSYLNDCVCQRFTVFSFKTVRCVFLHKRAKSISLYI